MAMSLQSEIDEREHKRHLRAEGLNMKAIWEVDDRLSNEPG
jgi:hypothetical protein